MEMRDYQTDAINNVKAEWTKNKNVILVMPCRSGKTHTFGQIIKDELGSVVVIAHRGELLTQISQTLGKREIIHKIIGSAGTIKECARASLISYGKNYIDPTAHVIVASVDTLIKTDPGEQWLKAVKLWVVDEAHHITAHEYDDETGKTIKGNKWGAVINLFPNARGLGVTATPTRSDGKGLGVESDGVFNSIVIGVKNAELESRGFIAPYRIYAPRSYIDLSNVTTGAGGDYVQAKLNKAVHESKITGDVVTHYLKLIPNKTAMVFCVDVEAATEQAAAFNTAGVPAMAASAKTPAIERINLKRKFDAGLIKVICNVDLYGEGVDVPSLEAVILARPSKSFPLVVQQFSRALTYYPNKTALIIDHVGNIEQHSRDWIKYIVRGEWTLNPADKKSRSSILPPTVRTCPLCFGVYPRDQGILCPYCNERPPVAMRKTIEQVEGDLFELAPETLQALQGKVTQNEKDYPTPYNATRPIISSLQRLSCEKREVLHGLRKAIGDWYRASGLDVPTAQRIFYLTFGYDVLTVQTLDKNEMILITEAIQNEIEK